MVEAPYVYLLARSGSAVKDQLLDVATRLEEFAELNNPVAINGIEYTDTMRIFSGRQNVSSIVKNIAIFKWPLLKPLAELNFVMEGFRFRRLECTDMTLFYILLLLKDTKGTENYQM